MLPKRKPASTTVPQDLMTQFIPSVRLLYAAIKVALEADTNTPLLEIHQWFETTILKRLVDLKPGESISSYIESIQRSYTAKWRDTRYKNAPDAEKRKKVLDALFAFYKDALVFKLEILAKLNSQQVDQNAEKVASTVGVQLNQLVANYRELSSSVGEITESINTQLTQLSENILFQNHPEVARVRSQMQNQLIVESTAHDRNLRDLHTTGAIDAEIKRISDFQIADVKIDETKLWDAATAVQTLSGQFGELEEKERSAQAILSDEKSEKTLAKMLARVQEAKSSLGDVKDRKVTDTRNQKLDKHTDILSTVRQMKTAVDEQAYFVSFLSVWHDDETSTGTVYNALNKVTGIISHLQSMAQTPAKRAQLIRNLLAEEKSITQMQTDLGTSVQQPITTARQSYATKKAALESGLKRKFVELINREKIAAVATWEQRKAEYLRVLEEKKRRLTIVSSSGNSNPQLVAVGRGQQLAAPQQPVRRNDAFQLPYVVPFILAGIFGFGLVGTPIVGWLLKSTKVLTMMTTVATSPWWVVGAAVVLTVGVCVSASVLLAKAYFRHRKNKALEKHAPAVQAELFAANENLKAAYVPSTTRHLMMRHGIKVASQNQPQNNPNPEVLCQVVGHEAENTPLYLNTQTNKLFFRRPNSNDIVPVAADDAQFAEQVRTNGAGL